MALLRRRMTVSICSEVEEQDKTLKLTFVGLGPDGNNTVPTKLKSMTLYELTDKQELQRCHGLSHPLAANADLLCMKADNAAEFPCEGLYKTHS